MPTDAVKNVFELILGILKDPRYGVPAGALGISLLAIILFRGLADPIAKIIRAVKGKQ